MAAKRPPLDLAAVGLLAAGFTVALCVLSYDPADPPFPSVYPAHPEPTNVLGLPGAWLAGELYTALGVAVYALLAAWFVLVLLLFQRHAPVRWVGRLVGWSVLLPTAAVLAELLGPESSFGVPAGHGGTLGAWLAATLEDALPTSGQVATLLAGLCLGAVLAADVVMLHLGRGAWFGATGATRGVVRAVRWLGSGERVATPVSPPAELLAVPAPKTGPRPRKSETAIPIHHHESEVEEAAAPRPSAGSETERYDDFELPPLTLLADPQPFPYQEQDQRLRQRASLLEKTFTDYNLNVKVVGINTGPVITQFEVSPETGLRVQKISALADDLARNLMVPSVRVVPSLPGKNTVGIEIPNEHRAVVRLKEVLNTGGKKAAKYKLPLYLGKDTEGRALVYDLAEMPHLLIAGTTGTGKSVCMNAIILSLLMTRRPDEVKMVMIDPKMLELSEYGKIPHLMHPVVKDMRKAEAILAWAVDKMEERYDLLSRARVRSIASYNELSHEEILKRVQPADDEEKARIPERMPYIVIFVDELSDLMMMMRKEVEGHIIRLAQKSRAAGIHLVVATQKPTVDVITGLIKSNLPARVCFQVRSRSDSRVVLDEMGADKLLGKGDMLFLQPGTSSLIRAQGTYLGDDEIHQVVEHLECDPCFAPELIQLGSGGDGPGAFLERLRERDDMYEAAIDVVIREQRGSVSLLQRSLGIGYGRAARLIDFMAEDGIVGGYNGSNAREVLYKTEQWEEMKAAAGAAA